MLASIIFFIIIYEEWNKKLPFLYNVFIKVASGGKDTVPKEGLCSEIYKIFTKLKAFQINIFGLDNIVLYSQLTVLIFTSMCGSWSMSAS